MSPSQFARVPGFVGSPLAAMNPKLLQGRVGQMLPPAPGFRAFFSAPPPATPPPPQQHPPGPGPHLQNLRYAKQMPLFVCTLLAKSLDICNWHVLSCYWILKLPNTEMSDSLQVLLWLTLPSSHMLPMFTCTLLVNHLHFLSSLCLTLYSFYKHTHRYHTYTYMYM